MSRVHKRESQPYVSDHSSPSSTASQPFVDEPSHMASLAYAWGKPDVTGELRQNDADFQVDEELGFFEEFRRNHKYGHGEQWVCAQQNPA